MASRASDCGRIESVDLEREDVRRLTLKGHMRPPKQARQLAPDYQARLTKPSRMSPNRFATKER